MAAASNDHHRLSEPSPWVRRFALLIPARGRVLDLACGGGRHARYLAGLGHEVEAVDRDECVLAGLADVERVNTRAADLENAPWPYAGQRFAAIVVTNYLHRPVFAPLLAALGDPAVLIYETFALGNEKFGKPSNPDFLLRPGELLALARESLRVVAYEDIFVSEPKPAMMQRICAVTANLALDRPGA